MLVNISKLNRTEYFENEKIIISFLIGDVISKLYVFIKDENGNIYDVLCKILPDINNQSFDKSNEKIKFFVIDKIDEWANKQAKHEKLINDNMKKRKYINENELKKLFDFF